MRNTPIVFLAAGTLAATALLGGCGSDDGTKTAGKAVEKVTGKSGVTMKGDSELDTAAYALVRVQSAKYSDYEIDGNTVRLKVRRGRALAGSECTIINAATETDYPNATFVIVEAGGKETPC